MKKCAENFNRFCPDYPEKCHLFGAFRELTNADRIRDMSDEELVVFLDDFSGRCLDCAEDEMNKSCPIYKEGHYCRPKDIMDWLRQPAEEVDHDSELCPYCHTNPDGYTRNLPICGNGKAYIWHHHHPIHGGWTLEVTKKNQAYLTVKINFCPICGRRLEDDHA